jgi:hypothetical protein
MGQRSVCNRIHAAAETLLLGLASENLGLLARDVGRLAEAVLLRGGVAMTPSEQAQLSQAVEASAARFLNHLAKQSTADLWESFAVPWDYARTLARVESGQYTAVLLEDAVWAVDRTVAMFSSMPPRSATKARKSARVQTSGRDATRFTGAP